MKSIYNSVISLSCPVFDIKIDESIQEHTSIRLINYFSNISKFHSGYSLSKTPGNFAEILHNVSGIFNIKITICLFKGYSMITYDSILGHKIEISEQTNDILEEFLEKRLHTILDLENERLEQEVEKIQKSDGRFFGLGRIVARSKYNTNKADLLFRTKNFAAAQKYYRNEAQYLHSREMMIYSSILQGDLVLNLDLLADEELYNTLRHIRVLWIAIACLKHYNICMKTVIRSVSAISKESFLVFKALFFIEIAAMLHPYSCSICDELLNSFYIFNKNNMQNMAYLAIEGICKNIFHEKNVNLLSSLATEYERKDCIKFILSSADTSNFRNSLVDIVVANTLLRLVGLLG